MFFKKRQLSAFIFLATSGAVFFNASIANADSINHTDEGFINPITAGSGDDTVVIDNTYVDKVNENGYMIDTGVGNDTLIFSNYQDGKIADNSLFNTGDGDDIIVFNTMYSDSNEASLDGASFLGGAGNDNITVQNNPYLLHFTMKGEEGNDTLQLKNVGNATLATMIGGDGNDILLVQNSTCSFGCYLDGDDVAQGITGGNNQLIITNSTVSIGESYDLVDDDGVNVGTVSGGINNFTDVVVTNHSSITIGGG